MIFKMKVHQRKYISILVLLLITTSCRRIKNKSEELATQAKEKIKNKTTTLIDKVVPHFDAYQPDTKFNKERFREFIQIEQTTDVKNIYCFGDAIGTDADYMFSFHCDSTTARKIIEKHQLTLDKKTTDYAFGLQHDFEWWDRKKIQKLDLYSWHDEHQYFKYFWYDGKEHKAYFFDFDM